MSLIRLLLLLAGLSSLLSTRAAEPVFQFETGPPAWRGERIALPPGFAPDLGWTGVEEIRFTGMQTNAALPAGTFQFKPPAGADVVKQ